MFRYFVTQTEMQRGHTNAGARVRLSSCNGGSSRVEGMQPDNKFELWRISIHIDMTATVPMYSMRLFAPMVA